ncbi:MAG: lipid-A-disaccharide synthase [Chiayiivirga sp.]|uniref:lipid-A-disaccharide synthase n=1 Tax=Chiayiivirga sp. TaxID=2041042 RepID=UPI0025C36D1D|nr:lipid-A-disaccharide synthase [Chiayiivirga sp.]MCI1729105.1 lipid-A-disaccharide synthase [Chiayiivirga sp.]
MTAPKRIALVAGEASGDLLGAGLITQLRERFPGAEFAGVGGPQMRAAGFSAWHDCSELAVMGLAEVLRHLPRLLRLRRTVRARLLAWKPDVFIGIDAPDFNLGLERGLKQRGIRTVHYVSPSVWAWRAGRAAKIGRSADRVLCLFPMEPPIYAQHGVDARFVGHPLADALPLHPDRFKAREALGLPLGAPVLALLPGSRLGEIARLGGVFLEAAARAAEATPDLRILVPAANPACRSALERLLEGPAPAALPAPQRDALRTRLLLLDGRAHEAMIAADVVLLASGTATLEALLAKRAMVVAYRISGLTYAIVRGLKLMKTDRYSLPNALAGERIVPELMQADCTAENLAREVLAWLQDPQRMANLQPRFEAIHHELKRDASARAAEAVAELLAAPRAALP